MRARWCDRPEVTRRVASQTSPLCCGPSTSRSLPRPTSAARSGRPFAGSCWGPRRPERHGPPPPPIKALPEPLLLPPILCGEMVCFVPSDQEICKAPNSVSPSMSRMSGLALLAAGMHEPPAAPPTVRQCGTSPRRAAPVHPPTCLLSREEGTRRGVWPRWSPRWRGPI